MLKWIKDVFTKNPRPRPPLRPTFRLRLERLEDRELLSGGPTTSDVIVKPPKPEPIPAITRELPPDKAASLSVKMGSPQPGPAVAQVLPSGGPTPDAGAGQPAVWNPVDPGNKASDANNWSTKQVPNGTPAVFNGNVANAPIVWDSSISPSSITVELFYNAQMTINSGVTVTATNGITEDGSAHSSLNVAFTDNTSKLVMSGGTGNWNNFQFTVAPNSNSQGEVDVTGGTVYAGNGRNYTETTQVPIKLLGGNMTLEPSVGNLWCPVILMSSGGVGAYLGVYSGVIV